MPKKDIVVYAILGGEIDDDNRENLLVIFLGEKNEDEPLKVDFYFGDNNILLSLALRIKVSPLNSKVLF